MKNKLFIILLSIIFSITMILTASFVLYQFLERSQASGQGEGSSQGKPLSASEMQANTVIMENIGTNLAGISNYIRLSIAFEMDSKKSKEEFMKIDFKVRDYVIRNLTDLTPQDIHGKDKLDQFTDLLLDKLNQDILTYGKVRQIYITYIAMQ